MRGVGRPHTRDKQRKSGGLVGFVLFTFGVKTKEEDRKCRATQGPRPDARTKS